MNIQKYAFLKINIYSILSYSFFIFVIYFIFSQYSYSQTSANIDIDEFMDALIEKGDELVDENKYDVAIEYYDRVLQVAPNDTETLFKKGEALFGLGNYEDAIQYNDKILELDPNDTGALDNKGKALDRLGRYDEAIQNYDKSLQIFPNNTDALYNKGVTLGNLSRYDEAIQYYDKVIELYPYYTDALKSKGLALDILGNYNEAIGYFDKALEYNPTDVEVLNKKGLALIKLGSYDEAIQNFDKVIEIDPNNTDALNSKNYAFNEFNATQNNKISEDFSVYENSTFGIKINYPKNWTIESQKEEYPLTNVAIFYSPENKDYVEVHIYTYDYSNIEIKTLRELLNDAIDSLTLYPNDFPEFKLLRTSITSTDKLADTPAYVLEGHYKDPEFGKQMILEKGMIKNNINYSIRYYASPSQYLNYLDDVEFMIQSFEIQNN